MMLGGGGGVKNMLYVGGGGQNGHTCHPSLTVKKGTALRNVFFNKHSFI